MKLMRHYNVAVGILVLLTTNLAIAQVKAPPLPRGSEKVKLHPGQNPTEMLRNKNAHERPVKDKTRDDRLPTAVTPSVTTTDKK